MFGRDDGETSEEYVRRMSRTSTAGYVAPVLPPLVELYDRTAALEARVADLEQRARSAPAEPAAPAP